MLQQRAGVRIKPHAQHQGGNGRDQTDNLPRKPAPETLQRGKRENADQHKSQFISVGEASLEVFTGDPLVRLVILLGRLCDHMFRQLRSRRLLVPVERFEIIAHELFIE